LGGVENATDCLKGLRCAGFVPQKPEWMCNIWGVPTYCNSGFFHFQPHTSLYTSPWLNGHEHKKQTQVGFNNQELANGSLQQNARLSAQQGEEGRRWLVQIH
jgi:hypothetical protein